LAPHKAQERAPKTGMEKLLRTTCLQELYTDPCHSQRLYKPCFGNVVQVAKVLCCTIHLQQTTTEATVAIGGGD